MTEPKYGSTSGYPGSSNGTGSGLNTGSGMSTGSTPSTGSIPNTGGSLNTGSGLNTGSSLGTGAANTQSGRSEPPRSPEQLREDIARTRSAISQDMAALGDKLKPDTLKENAKEVLTHAKDSAREGAKDLVRDAKDAAFDSLRHAKEHAIESISESVNEFSQRARVAGHGVQDFVATHAIPLTLAGVGLGWLMVSLSHQRRVRVDSYYSEGGYGGEDYLERDYRGVRHGRHRGYLAEARERVGEVTQRASYTLQEGRERLVNRVHDVEGQVVERAGELRSQVVRGASQLGHEAAELSHRAYDGIGRAGSRAYEGMGRAGHRAVEVSEQNPLATGLLALAAGVAAGFLLPPTRRENQLLGGTRDRLLQTAQRSASELKQSIEHGAAEVRGVIAEVQHPSH